MPRSAQIVGRAIQPAATIGPPTISAKRSFHENLTLARLGDSLTVAALLQPARWKLKTLPAARVSEDRPEIGRETSRKSDGRAWSAVRHAVERPAAARSSREAGKKGNTTPAQR